MGTLNIQTRLMKRESFEKKVCIRAVSVRCGVPYMSDPEFINHFSCLTQLNMEFVLLIYLLLLTVAYSFSLRVVEHEHFSANKYETAYYCWHFHIYSQRKFHIQLNMKKVL